MSARAGGGGGYEPETKGANACPECVKVGIEVDMLPMSETHRAAAQRHLHRLHCSDAFLSVTDAISIDVLDDQATLRFSDEAGGTNVRPETALELLASLPDGAGPELTWKVLNTGTRLPRVLDTA